MRECTVKLTDDHPEILAQFGIRTGIRALVETTREVPIEALGAQTKKRLTRMTFHGTTITESKSGYGLATGLGLQMLRLNHRLDERLLIDIYSTSLGVRR